MGYYEGEISGLGCNNNNGMGSSWEGLIGLVLVAGLLGNGNFGGLFGGGRNGNAGADFAGWQLGRLATTNDVASGFSTSEIMSDLNDIILGQAQMQNFINQGFAGLNQTVTNGFAGVNNAICTLGYQNQAGFNTLANQIASCCCDLKQLNLENRYLNERQTCDIVAAINAGNQRLVDIYTTDKLASKDARIAALEAQISNAEQSAYLLNELKPCPKASYLVQPPQPVTFPTNCCGNVAYANYGFGACGASVQ